MALFARYMAGAGDYSRQATSSPGGWPDFSSFMSAFQRLMFTGGARIVYREGLTGMLALGCRCGDIHRLPAVRQALAPQPGNHNHGYSRSGSTSAPTRWKLGLCPSTSSTAEPPVSMAIFCLDCDGAGYPLVVWTSGLVISGLYAAGWSVRL